LELTLWRGFSKPGNVGTLLRSASAFDAAGILCVGGQRKHLQTFGAHGADRRLSYWFFDSLGECITYAKQNLGCVDIVGVEIRHDAVAVGNNNAFRGTSAFLLGNEGLGMDPAHLALCTRVVYIPQFGGGTASLNVAVAAGIVFHRFASWGQFKERDRLGEKFLVDAVNNGKEHSGDLLLRAKRLSKKQEGQSADLDGAGQAVGVADGDEQ